MLSARFNLINSFRHEIPIIAAFLCAFLFSSGCAQVATPVKEAELIELQTPSTAIVTEEATYTSLPDQTEETIEHEGATFTTPPDQATEITQEQQHGEIGPAEQLFSSSTYSNEIPENIAKEIAFFERGGGGEVESSFKEGNPELLYIRTYGNGGLYQPTRIYTCGWNRDDRVKVSLYLPDGRINTLDLHPDDETKLIFTTQPEFGDPPGQYQVDMEGESGKLEAYFQVDDLGISGLSQLNDRVLLYHFAPFESVNLYAYRKHGPYGEWKQFTGWQKYQVDEGGKLTIHISPEFQREGIVFMAIGDISGIPKEITYVSGSEWENPICNNALPKRVRIGSVAITIIDEIYLYEDIYDPSTFEVRQLTQASRLNILDGPVCIESQVYWLVSFYDGSEGWVSEGRNKIYNIEPYESQSVDIITGSCPDAPPQRVQVGDRAYVCTKNDRLILRENPNREAAEITSIDPGTQMMIIDGPECADKWSWWKVKTESGDMGWVSEGGDDLDPYYICPTE